MKLALKMALSSKLRENELLVLLKHALPGSSQDHKYKRINGLEELWKTGVDVICIREEACEKGQSRMGKVKKELVKVSKRRRLKK